MPILKEQTAVNRGRRDSTPPVSTLVDLLRWRAQVEPEREAYTFLVNGEEESERITYAELDRQAQTIAGFLQKLGPHGERALLLYPSGLEFIAAFFGCLYAGWIAVPAYPPHTTRLSQTLPRLRSIFRDAQPRLALTESKFLSKAPHLFELAPDLKELRWQASDALLKEPPKDWRDPGIAGESLAFLQYTSGSTAEPKGVMVSHANLLHNQRMIAKAFQHSEFSTVVGWLPLYHDMGLIGNVLQPLYLGARCILMSPVSFLQRPSRWLQAITRYQAHTSGGPNFAYELCAQKISAEQRAGLDLRSWKLAFNGAEPVRPDTLERFADAFKSCGFQREAFYPCYGLAEATLLVTGGRKASAPRLYAVKASALDRKQAIPAAVSGEARTLVSCGRPWLNGKVLIVDPDSHRRCRPGRIGEIWISGLHVAQGYWNHPEETEATFRAHLAGAREGLFLRTGDLGFIAGGELYVTGRLKDLIIIGGRNHYPQDIEQTMERSHPALRTGACAAFSVELDSEERLVVVAEMDPRHKPTDADRVAAEGSPPCPTHDRSLTTLIRQAVAETHELQVFQVVLVKLGSLPKTSSGKVQRHLCRTKFLAGEFQEQHLKAGICKGIAEHRA
jgi:acyl-CoA synthetase (AMP-forming)/AMP-acid ligase II